MQKALAPEVSTWPEKDPQLLGTQCGDCGATTWPAQQRCPRCSGPNMAELRLPRRGTLVTWTTQMFPPKSPFAGKTAPADFVPFGVGLVQLGDVVRVETRLTESDPEKLQFGMDVELVVETFYVDEAGDEIMTVAFAPLSKES